jgi:hypothetical protein
MGGRRRVELHWLYFLITLFITKGINLFFYTCLYEFLLFFQDHISTVISVNDGLIIFKLPFHSIAK